MVEIREDFWQGTIFNYPAIRIDLGKIDPIGECTTRRIEFSILCFSENASSREANHLAKAVNDQLHEKSFTQNNIKYVCYSIGLIPATRIDERTWRSEARFKAIVDEAPT